MTPAHLLVPGTERHGVTILARQLAERTGAQTVHDHLELPPGTPLHVHFTDRLFGADAVTAAGVVVAMADRHRLTLTLHDVPQPTDGDAFADRRTAYRRVLQAAAGWVACSETERATVVRHCSPPRDGAVVPLPLVTAPHPARPAVAGPVAPGDATVAVFGWVYPGKGHVEAIEAAALLGDSPDRRPRVVALGAVAEGHEDLRADLEETAGRLGVRLTITGWLSDAEVAEGLAEATVGLVAHGNVSASGSLHSWIAAGRRPLVADSPYAREVRALRPGTLELLPRHASAEQVAERVRERLVEPSLGDLDEPAPGPHLPEVARAYQAWWRRWPALWSVP
ncbi:hypothetical protein [Nocardioides sp. CFH 31398]|uniref:hypothetical protein n=1 Tax=Nocardioides sp. CFH 31398 TaxID=2919579 RepID=UPI001F052A58|nr:hypothetical protein [Nocardioides sp. CFH 31398]MCH1868719.1 hypothetical protein [Nocardioides sp. CFH 31398]